MKNAQAFDLENKQLRRDLERVQRITQEDLAEQHEAMERKP